MSRVVHRGITFKGIDTIKSVYKNLNRNPITKLAFKGQGIKLVWFDDSLVFESKDKPIDASKTHLISQQYQQLGLKEGEDFEVKVYE